MDVWLFFSWYGRSRSEARSLHKQKQPSRKQLHGHRWSHAAWQIIKTKTQTTRNNRGVMVRTSPNNTCSIRVDGSSVGVIPTMAMSRPVPTGQTLWWCASLSSNSRTSVCVRLGCWNAKASCPPVTFQLAKFASLMEVRQLDRLPFLPNRASTLHCEAGLIVAVI